MNYKLAINEQLKYTFNLISRNECARLMEVPLSITSELRAIFARYFEVSLHVSGFFSNVSVSSHSFRINLWLLTRNVHVRHFRLNSEFVDLERGSWKIDPLSAPTRIQSRTFFRKHTFGNRIAFNEYHAVKSELSLCDLTEFI